MGYQFAIDMALEGVKETVTRVTQSVSDKYTKYQSWMSEAEAAVPHLTKLDDTRKMRVLPFNDAVLMIKGVDALTKILQQVQRKVPVDISKTTQMNDLKKIGLAATPDTLDTAEYNTYSWAHPTDKPKMLKELGWNGGKASTFAKAFAAALKNVGPFNTFENWTTSAVTEYTNTKDQERYRELTRLVKQAQQIVKIRHTLINDAYKQFSQVKKAI